MAPPFKEQAKAERRPLFLFSGAGLSRCTTSKDGVQDVSCRRMFLAATKFDANSLWCGAWRRH